MRKAFLERNTQETRIRMDLNLDGSGQWDLNTGIPFFDHMLSHIIKHSRIDCRLQLEGDLGIDCHHSVEDTAIVMGQLIHQALGDKAGLERYGHSVLPMDETLTTVAVDMGGRFAFHYQGPSTIKEGKFGIYDAELSLEFLQKLAMNARMNLHVVVHYGDNRHHIHESVFKALGRSFRMAFQRNGSDIPSTKGLLE